MTLDMFSLLVQFYHSNPAIFILDYLPRYNWYELILVLKTHPKYKLTEEMKKKIQDAGFDHRLPDLEKINN